MSASSVVKDIKYVKELGQRLSNWGRWGDDDEIGTLNFVTPQKRVEACKLAVSGKVFDLGMPFDSDGPWSPGPPHRFNPIHLMSVAPVDPLGDADGAFFADDVIIMPLQCGTQWDGLAHVGYDGVFYNNVPMTAVTTRRGATRLPFGKGIDRLISRGVLLDIPRLKGVGLLEDSTEITADDLTAAEEFAGVQVTSGDILLVRTGFYQHFLAGDRARYVGEEPGLGLSTLEWLHEREVAAVALDNWAVDVRPSGVEGSTHPLHLVALRDMGLTFGEMFNLEDLAADCAQDGVYEFLFTGTGLNISGSVGSPVTPMVIK